MIHTSRTPRADARKEPGKRLQQIREFVDSEGPREVACTILFLEKAVDLLLEIAPIGAQRDAAKHWADIAYADIAEGI